MLSTSEKVWAIVVVIVLVLALYFSAVPAGRASWNTWMYGVQKVDDATSYETLEMVETTARSMIASYAGDRLTYEQGKDSPDRETRNYAEAAKTRANRTATTYNILIRDNSFKWRDGLPKDIQADLEIIP